MAVTTRFGLTILEQAQQGGVALMNANSQLLDAGAAGLTLANTFTLPQVFASTVSFGGLIGGSGGGIPFKAASVSPTSDADFTVLTADYPALILSLVTGSWASGHNIILPNTAGAVWHVTNNTPYSATFKTAAGAGVAVATLRCCFVRGNSVDIKRMSPDSTL